MFYQFGTSGAYVRHVDLDCFKCFPFAPIAEYLYSSGSFDGIQGLALSVIFHKHASHGHGLRSLLNVGRAGGQSEKI